MTYAEHFVSSLPREYLARLTQHELRGWNPGVVLADEHYGTVTDDPETRGAFAAHELPGDASMPLSYRFGLAYSARLAAHTGDKQYLLDALD